MGGLRDPWRTICDTPRAAHPCARALSRSRVRFGSASGLARERPPLERGPPTAPGRGTTRPLAPSERRRPSPGTTRLPHSGASPNRGKTAGAYERESRAAPASWGRNGEARVRADRGSLIRKRRAHQRERLLRCPEHELGVQPEHAITQPPEHALPPRIGGPPRGVVATIDFDVVLAQSRKLPMLGAEVISEPHAQALRAHPVAVLTAIIALSTAFGDRGWAGGAHESTRGGQQIGGCPPPILSDSARASERRSSPSLA